MTTEEEIKMLFQAAGVYATLAPTRLFPIERRLDVEDYDRIKRRDTLVGALFPLVSDVTDRALLSILFIGIEEGAPSVLSNRAHNWEKYISSDLPQKLTPFQRSMCEYLFKPPQEEEMAEMPS